MLFSEAATEALKTYLVSTLERISDADSTVLADYVIALLKHDKAVAALKEDCLAELVDFLANETEDFVQQLFEALANDAFSNASIAGPSDAIELSAVSHDQSATQDIDANSSLPLKRSRKETNDGSDYVAQYSDDRPDKIARTAFNTTQSNGNRESAYNKSESSTELGSKQFDGSRDNNQGMDHRFGSRNDRDSRSNNTRGNNNMDSRRGHCFNYEAKGYCLRGEACPYNHGPEALLIDNMNATARQNGMTGFGMNSAMMQGNGTNQGNFPQMGTRPMDPLSGAGSRPQFNQQGRSWPTRGGGQSGRGGFAGHTYQQRTRKSDTVLVVENIPLESCAMDKVNAYFKAFGALTNIQVDPATQKAVIQYSNAHEALDAYRSPDPIFGNRFVKVYWQTEPVNSGPVHGSDGKPAVASHNRYQLRTDASQTAGGATVPAEHATNDGTAADAHRAAAEELRRMQQEKAKAILELHKSQEALISKQIGEQKKMMERLEKDTTLSAKDRKELLLSIKSLSLQTESMVAKAATQAQSIKSRATAKPVTTTSSTDAAAGESVDPELQTQLLALKGEAQSLGITDPTAKPVAGLGRGRGGWNRGRGGYTPRAFNIDNRSTKISISPVSESNLEAIRTHFEAFDGFVEFVKLGDDSAMASYQMRWQAEKAMSSQLSGEGMSEVELQWATVATGVTESTEPAPE
ncbi:hypothetical protein O5D80_006143 [Batrachochytrium dendrobatidis]|nr:hypothetical protein O5D80_006143 [Batrachochytrium dendrobatidis]